MSGFVIIFSTLALLVVIFGAVGFKDRSAVGSGLSLSDWESTVEP